MAKKTTSVPEIFVAKGADKIYAALASGIRKRVGARQAVEELKQTCVHIVAGEGGTAYAGLHPRKGAVLLNLRLDKPLKSPRIRKIEQASRNRYHCELVLSSVNDVDDELAAWVEQAWQLASTR